MAASDHDWSTRHSVLTNAHRTADLVNVLVDDAATAGKAPQPTDQVRDQAQVAAVTEAQDRAQVAAVAEVLRTHGESGPPPTAADLPGMRAVAQRIYEVFAARDTDAAAAALNTLLARNSRALRLSSHGGSTPWHPHLDSGDDAPWDEWFLASSCLALLVLVWDTQRPVGGVCAAAGCARVFLAQGSGLARRYCSRRCATRERVAAHRRARV